MFFNGNVSESLINFCDDYQKKKKKKASKRKKKPKPFVCTTQINMEPNGFTSEWLSICEFIGFSSFVISFFKSLFSFVPSYLLPLSLSHSPLQFLFLCFFK